MAESAIWPVWYCGERAYPDGEGVYLSPLKSTVDWSECERIAKETPPPLAGKGVGQENRNRHDIIMLARKAFEQYKSLRDAHLP